MERSECEGVASVNSVGAIVRMKLVDQKHHGSVSEVARTNENANTINI